MVDRSASKKCLSANRREKPKQTCLVCLDRGVKLSRTVPISITGALKFPFFNMAFIDWSLIWIWNGNFIEFMSIKDWYWTLEDFQPITDRHAINENRFLEVDYLIVYFLVSNSTTRWDFLLTTQQVQHAQHAGYRVAIIYNQSGDKRKRMEGILYFLLYNLLYIYWEG